MSTCRLCNLVLTLVPAAAIWALWFGDVTPSVRGQQVAAVAGLMFGLFGAATIYVRKLSKFYAPEKRRYIEPWFRAVLAMPIYGWIGYIAFIGTFEAGYNAVFGVATQRVATIDEWRTSSLGGGSYPTFVELPRLPGLSLRGYGPNWAPSGTPVVLTGKATWLGMNVASMGIAAPESARH